jgi:hypothetical protein
MPEMSDAASVQQLLKTETLADLGPGRRANTLSTKEIDRALDNSTEASGESVELIRALLYLWHDHLDEAHSIAQGIENRDGSYVHALMHRREPDYGNAKYWFRRVGKHPAYAQLPERAEKVLTGTNATLRKELIRGGEWDAFAFVDCCERAAGSKEDFQTLLQQLQAEEFTVLLNHLLGEA